MGLTAFWGPGRLFHGQCPHRQSLIARGRFLYRSEAGNFVQPCTRHNPVSDAHMQETVWMCEARRRRLWFHHRPLLIYKMLLNQDLMKMLFLTPGLCLRQARPKVEQQHGCSCSTTDVEDKGTCGRRCSSLAAACEATEDSAEADHDVTRRAATLTNAHEMFPERIRPSAEACRTRN